MDALGGIRLTDDPWERNRILRCSIFRFKGLERMVVGLCELDGAREQALYVGLSRPSVFLSLFVPNVGSTPDSRALATTRRSAREVKRALRQSSVAAREARQRSRGCNTRTDES